MSPPPNRTYTFQRIRLSILEKCSRGCTFHPGSIRMPYFSSMEHKDCLPFPQRLAFVSVATAYTLADPAAAGCSTHYRQTLGTMETPLPYRCSHASEAPAEAILHFSLSERRHGRVSCSSFSSAQLQLARAC
jgi:hypothetical protein